MEREAVDETDGPECVRFNGIRFSESVLEKRQRTPQRTFNGTHPLLARQLKERQIAGINRSTPCCFDNLAGFLSAMETIEPPDDPFAQPKQEHEPRADCHRPRCREHRGGVTREVVVNTGIVPQKT